MQRQVLDQVFKQMAVELSTAKGSVKIAAAELGIDPGRVSKWQQTLQDSKAAHSEKPGLTAEQLKIRRLQKELKEAQLEPDITEPMLTTSAGPKKAVGIFSKGDSRYSGL